MQPSGPDVGRRRDIVVRRVGPGDWQHVRSVRLRALEESPTAFGSSLAEEEDLADDDWRAWTRESATFVAYHAGAPVGMAAGVDGEQPDERRLVAAWVDPGHRRLGAASGLVTAVEHWAREDGAARLTLWVTRSNVAAVDLYRRHGFTGTGRCKPLPSNPVLTEVLLVLALEGAGDVAQP